MLPENKKHVRAVALRGGAICVLAAAASLFKFPPAVASGLIIGGALSLSNVYAIVLVAEALTAAARNGIGMSGAVKGITAGIYVIKLIVITAVLVVLVYFKLANLFALLIGFTVVLVAHVLVGLGRLTARGEGEAEG